ncbi:hypothetical protein MK632_29120 [Rhizobium changzhiense]|uniref:Uncharacterized protein n=1 Tax=Rhizobium changzhiense TaxID=2692317 RepID=A0A7Z0UEC4_9HYPH|nr:hypothetical protein [Rhizobium changzhiense]MCH4549764.1 hypothetical protein [Rhizobium changzhiense]NZD64230.1 hypothetical protein [Rhizobium changzhiense]
MPIFISPPFGPAATARQFQPPYHFPDLVIPNLGIWSSQFMARLRCRIRALAANSALNIDLQKKY